MTPDVLTQLTNVRGRGPWTARCPTHDDRHNSLYVFNHRDSGRLVVRCLAGCPTQDVRAALDVCADISTSVRPLSTGGVRVSWPHIDPAPVPVALPPSVDELGLWRDTLHHWPELIGYLRERKGWPSWLFDMLDLGACGNRVTMPVTHGGPVLGATRYRPGADPKMLGAPGVRRSWWPWPSAVLHGDGPLWIVEGEPDAASAFACGIPAVAIPGVAFQPTIEDIEGLGSPRRTIVCLDADAAGRAAAKRLSSVLEMAGHLVTVLDLHPGRHDGADLGDLVAGTAGDRRSLDDLRRRLERKVSM